MPLSAIRAVISDMDGVLWRGDTPLPGLSAFFALLRARGLPFVLATNNSFRTPAYYVEKLARLGIAGVPTAAIVTSASATADYLHAHYPPDTRVYVLGGDGIREALAAFPQVETDAQVVVAGIDPHLTYDKLKRAALHIRAGAAFVGTNPDRTFPTPEGLVPGAGSILAALATATDVQPVIIGKPGLPMFESAGRVLAVPPQHTLMIGDRLDTDILGGQRAGMCTALVLTGVSTRTDVDAENIYPDTVYDGLDTLTAALGA